MTGLSPEKPNVDVVALARAAKDAARSLSFVSTARKDAVLMRVSQKMRGEAGRAVLLANEKDMVAAKEAQLSDAMRDRLYLDRKRLDGVAAAVDHVRSLPDPVGEVLGLRRLQNGLEVGRMRVPLGLVAIIYESRPNVTSDAAALCLKSGNACILRGGKEAFHTNIAIARLFEEALSEEGLPVAAVTLLKTTDREAAKILLSLDGIVDLAIPRGGEQLIEFVSQHARVPVIKHYKGVCHVYVDGEADLDQALAIAINAKVQRPGVCNAMETLLVDHACAETFLPKLVSAMETEKVELRGDERVCGLFPHVRRATPADWDTEHLAKTLSLAVVDGLDGALSHIARHGTLHTEAIVTRNYDKARRFLHEVDASLVLVNASTRFNDGGELGLGAEIGISTTKLHAYGPMGLSELCTTKWIAFGDGQVRK